MYAPTALTNDPTTTTDTVIRFTWTAPAYDGGSPLIDYTVYWDQGDGTDNYVLLEENVPSEEYTTSVTLIAGTTYSFKVLATNLVGDSPLSSEVAILAAKEPDAPVNLANVPG